jgi:hypothetical protein
MKMLERLLIEIANIRYPRIFSKEKILRSYQKNYFDKVVLTNEYKEAYQAVNEFVIEWDRTVGKERFKKRYPIGSYQKYTLKVDKNILFNKDRTKCIIPILYQMEERVHSDEATFITGRKDTNWLFKANTFRYVMRKESKQEITPFDELSKKSLSLLLDDGYIGHFFRRINYYYIDNHFGFKNG